MAIKSFMIKLYFGRSDGQFQSQRGECSIWGGVADGGPDNW